jgi:hypothetical protein
MANKDKILNLPWQIGREFTVYGINILLDIGIGWLTGYPNQNIQKKLFWMHTVWMWFRYPIFLDKKS